MDPTNIAPRRKYCCKYPGCTNWYYTRVPEGFVNKRFHRCPTDPDLHQQWRNVCKIDEQKVNLHFRICEDHFVDSDFVNERKERLNFGAIPLDISAVNANKSSSTLKKVASAFTMSEENVDSNIICSCLQPSTSSSVCCYSEPCLFSPCQDCEVTSNSNVDNFHDHSYNLANSNEIPSNLNKFTFLEQGKDGILSKIGLSEKELTPKKAIMYKAHRNIRSRLTKLSKLLEKERGKLKILENLYNAGKFSFIDANLNVVTKEFINSQLRNCDSKPNARRWTEQDKAFALSLYKRSPRLYRYLQAYFQLPSSRTLKAILAKIPFNTGINPAILEHLAGQVTKMKGADRYCTLLFDEMSLCEGFHYERAKQFISGYEDIGSLGRTNKAANHALVFMIRGIRHQWKQVVAYYFTLNTVRAAHLKFLIEEIISQLQTVGLNVVGTVCDQGPTNRSALNQLCARKHPRQSPYYFFVNDHPIVTIYDVPHLLKNTRNALLKCRIQFDPQNIHKSAKFEYIESVFNFDQQKTFKSLPKLKKEHFNFKDSYVKMKVKVAAAQLSSSVAAAIDTFVTFTNIVPAEAIYTAEFVQKIDYLFDSLNSSGPAISGNKPYRCALSENSPHLEFWSKLLSEMNHWKLIDLTNGTDVTNRYSFVEGWQTTIKSVKFLWDRLKDVDGFNYLNLRSFNQDSLENLFSCIRQHGAANTNPTCHQFTAALKTVVINKLMMATGGDSNCENDNCTPLGDLFNLTKFTGDNLSQEVEDVPQSEISMTFKATDFADIPPEDTQGLAYVAGWVLKNVQVPDCGTCRNILYSDSVTSRHLLTSFRERDDVQRLTYASEHVMLFIQNLHDSLNDFLLKNGHKEHLENTFKEIFHRCVDFEQMNCMEHNCLNLILEKSLPFLIFKFCRDKRKQTTVSEGHRRKMRRLM